MASSPPAHHQKGPRCPSKPRMCGGLDSVVGYRGKPGCMNASQPHIEEVTTMSSDCCTPGSAPAPTGPAREFHRRGWAKQKEGVPGFELIPHIHRLVAEGEPVELSRLADAAGQPVRRWRPS